jgi:hypothetical protein
MPTFAKATASEAQTIWINQIIYAWEGVANYGNPLKLIAINDAGNYCLDIMNLDATNSRALRVRDNAGGIVFSVDKNEIYCGRNVSVVASGTVDGVDIGAHDHTGTTKGLQLTHANLANLASDDHTQYYNAARHNKAVHDALGINAATLGGFAATDFAPWADFKQSQSDYASANWALPAATTWADVDSLSISLTLANTCDLVILFTANIAALAADYTGTANLKAFVDATELEVITTAKTEGAMCLNGHWYKAAVAAGARTVKAQFMQSTIGGTRYMGSRRLSVIAIPVA